MIRDDGMEFDERRRGIREQEVKEVLFDGSLVLETAAPSAHYDGGGRNEIRLHHIHHRHYFMSWFVCVLV